MNYEVPHTLTHTHTQIQLLENFCRFHDIVTGENFGLIVDLLIRKKFPIEIEMKPMRRK